ncbi:MAG: hypothetical protein [Bacteriophage sp.]|nr:MAG: hypothetical protein [Bacteriophage sp.]
MINNLRYWCHKILPLVYDDSLSYYEVLCKTSAKLNEVIDSTNDLLATWDTYKNDIDKAFGDYTAGLDKKFDDLSAKISRDIDDYRYRVNESIQDEFAKQEQRLTAQDDKIAAQDTQITAIYDKVNTFITEYNKTIAQIPAMVVDAVNAWLNDTTHYDNIIADLAGSLQGLKHFDTVADLKTATFTQITGKEICVCENYYVGDGVFTMWEILERQTPPGAFAEGIVHIALPHADGDLYYRVAFLRSEYTATTLGIATAPTVTARNTQMIACCKYNFNPLLIDADFTVDLSDINTTTKTLKVYSNPSAKHTITLVNGNNFISSFSDVKIMHDTNNLKHATYEGVSFDNCDIVTKDGATVVVSNVNIKNCTITASQIQCTDEYTNTDYFFTGNTWTANTIFGVVLTSATVDSLRNCVISNNLITNLSATRTRLVLSSNIPARNVKITDNVIYNPHISSDTPLADGIIGGFTSVGTASEFTLTITGNTLYSSTLNTALTLGQATDTYHKFTMIYRDNNIMLNKGTAAVPVWSSVLSTSIQTNGAFYPNFVGDLDIAAKLVLQHAVYSGGDVTTTKVLPFNPARCVGYAPQSDGTLNTSELNAYYKADVTIVCAGVDTSIPFPNFVQIEFAGVRFSAFLDTAPTSTLRATLYIEPSNLADIDGIIQMSIRSNGAISSVDGDVKLFRLA